MSLLDWAKREVEIACKKEHGSAPNDEQKRKSVAYPINQEFLAHIKAAVLEEYFRKLELIQNSREGNDIKGPAKAEDENQPTSETPEEKSPDQNMKTPSIDDDYKEED